MAYTSLAAPRHESGRVVLLIALDDCGRIGRITLISPCVSSTHPVRRLEALPSRACARLNLRFGRALRCETREFRIVKAAISRGLLAVRFMRAPRTCTL